MSEKKGYSLFELGANIKANLGSNIDEAVLRTTAENLAKDGGLYQFLDENEQSRMSNLSSDERYNLLVEEWGEEGQYVGTAEDLSARLKLLNSAQGDTRSENKIKMAQNLIKSYESKTSKLERVKKIHESKIVALTEECEELRETKADLQEKLKDERAKQKELDSNYEQLKEERDRYYEVLDNEGYFDDGSSKFRLKYDVALRLNEMGNRIRPLVDEITGESRGRPMSKKTLMGKVRENKSPESDDLDGALASIIEEVSTHNPDESEDDTTFTEPKDGAKYTTYPNDEAYTIGLHLDYLQENDKPEELDEVLTKLGAPKEKDIESRLSFVFGLPDEILNQPANTYLSADSNSSSTDVGEYEQEAKQGSNPRIDPNSDEALTPGQRMALSNDYQSQKKDETVNNTESEKDLGQKQSKSKPTKSPKKNKRKAKKRSSKQKKTPKK